MNWVSFQIICDKAYFQKCGLNLKQLEYESVSGQAADCTTLSQAREVETEAGLQTLVQDKKEIHPELRVDCSAVLPCCELRFQHVASGLVILLLTMETQNSD